MIKHIELPWQDNFFKNMDYEASLFRDPIQVSAWKEAGHHIDSTAILINQTYKISDFPQVELYFKELKNMELSFHCLTPGHYLPTHSDKYSFFRNKHGVDSTSKIRRYIIFLEDSKEGHYLVVDGTVYNKWKAGDIVGWIGETPHSAINLGTENRYTAQITGIYDN